MSAHIPGNNQHHDFFGDCWSGCTAAEVISATQGKQSNGSAVAADRSDSSKTLGMPDMSNAVGEFFSLGFGGSIILKMDGGILNRPGNDLRISETSFNQPACSSYPEKAEIFVSDNMVNWTSLGVICQDAEVDIAPLDWILYVKVVDVSVASEFSVVVDGFDLDGIQCLNAPMQRKLAVEEKPSFSIFPVPATDNLNVRYAGFMDSDVLQIEVYGLDGKQEMKTEIWTDGAQGTFILPINGLSNGQHFLNITSGNGKEVLKFVKN